MIAESERNRVFKEDAAKNIALRKISQRLSSKDLLEAVGSRATSPKGSAANSRSVSRTGTVSNLEQLRLEEEERAKSPMDKDKHVLDNDAHYATLATHEMTMLTPEIIHDMHEGRQAFGEVESPHHVSLAAVGHTESELFQESKENPKEKNVYRTSVVNNYQKIQAEHDSFVRQTSGGGLGSRHGSRTAMSRSGSRSRMPSDMAAEAEANRAFKQAADPLHRSSSKEMGAPGAMKVESVRSSFASVPSRNSSGNDLRGLLSNSRNASSSDLKAIGSMYDLELILEDGATAIDE
jgi:hypothetical protein